VALLADAAGQILQRLETGPANMKLLSEAQLAARFRSIASAMPSPDAVGIGLSGAWVEADFQKIRTAAARVWPGIPCCATNDLETALTAAREDAGGTNDPRVLIVSGTGSGCYGKRTGGAAVKVGAWGHVLGDNGSGYDIGLKALRVVIDHYDHEGRWPDLGRRLLRALQQNEPNDLIDWVQAADKTAIAGLAAEVFAAWHQKDKLAAQVLAVAAKSLARDAAACAHKLARRGTAVRFVLAGTILLRQPRFATLVARKLHQLWPNAVVAPLRRESVWGAVALARQLGKAEGQRPKAKVRAPQPPSDVVRSRRRSPTEERNPRSMKLDRLSQARAITLMLSEDARVPRKLLTERRRIEQAIRLVVRALRRGGRLFYVGAGTSGRLGVLDASECPPTFSTPPDLVQGIIAGGQYALWQSVEGAEDDSGAGARAVEFRGVGRRDAVVGIAASGTTPFVWGALGAARRRGAATLLICFNPFLQIPPAARPTVVIAPNLGPEVLTGSTRLKAGTATKLLLNMITTLAMVRLGKVRSNLMIDLNPANVKLWDRAIRIVQALTGADHAAARAALERSGWVIRKAIGPLCRS
jgi:N-acetylmuramic acid 6-phosphate etherase